MTSFIRPAVEAPLWNTSWFFRSWSQLVVASATILSPPAGSMMSLLMIPGMTKGQAGDGQTDHGSDDGHLRP